MHLTPRESVARGGGKKLPILFERPGRTPETPSYITLFAVLKLAAP